MYKDNKKHRTAIHSLRDAWRGFCYTLRTQRNFQIEVIIAIIIVPGVLFLPMTFVERTGIYFFIVLVLFAELINTAIERAVDSVSPEYHPVAGIAKDIAAAAVLIVGTAAIIYTLIIIWVVNGRF